MEAENGEKALEILAENQVDILITDIKMPFMDGLELSRIARETYPNLKIIIYSAYGEFDYAKKAIDLSVFHYLLKPIEINEFFKVITTVIEKCSLEQKKEEQEKSRLEGYLAHEKEKILMELISGTQVNRTFIQRMEEADLQWKGKSLRMMLVDVKSPFFERLDNEFMEMLRQVLLQDYICLNLNEFQSLIFVVSTAEINMETFVKFGEQIRDQVSNRYKELMTVVIGQPLNNIEAIKNDYDEIEKVLDYKFFFEEGTLLFTDQPIFHTRDGSPKSNEVLGDVYTFIDLKDYYQLEQSIDLLFYCFKSEGAFSVVYVMYICSEIIKKMYENTADVEEFHNYIEVIFTCRNLLELKQHVTAIIAKLQSRQAEGNEDWNKKVIRTIIKVVEDHYSEELSLEAIAKKVFLSPGYISYSFKKGTNISLNKYITKYRLEKAKALLFDTNMRIADISAKVGYTDVSYFIKTFRNHYGLSPAKFREREELR